MLMAQCPKISTGIRTNTHTRSHSSLAQYAQHTHIHKIKIEFFDSFHFGSGESRKEVMATTVTLLMEMGSLEIVNAFNQELEQHNSAFFPAIHLAVVYPFVVFDSHLTWIANVQEGDDNGNNTWLYEHSCRRRMLMEWTQCLWRTWTSNELRKSPRK